MLGDDFENFAGKTQTFQVKPKHIRSTIPCVCMFILFLLLCYCATRKISNHSDTLFMQKTSTVECISVLKSDFILLIKSQILCNGFFWFCERMVAFRYLERRLENEISPRILSLLFSLLSHAALKETLAKFCVYLKLFKVFEWLTKGSSMMLVKSGIKDVFFKSTDLHKK